VNTSRRAEGRHLARAAFRSLRLIPTPVRHRLVGLTSPAFRVGVVGVVLSDDRRILLARHNYRRGWGIPGGMLGWRELPRQAVHRELREEVGLEVREVGTPEILVSRSPRRIEWYFDMALAEGCAVEDAHPISAEIAETRWFPLDDIPILEKGTGTTVAALRVLLKRRFPDIDLDDLGR